MSLNNADEYRDWSEIENKFNNQIRDSLIHVLIGAFSIILAHYKLRHWRRPLDDELPDLANLNDIHDLRTKEANKNDHIVYRIGQLACTFGVSVGFCCLSLVPLSVLSNELKVFCLDQCPDWWLQWLTVDLIMKFWSRVSILCSIFLFGILPCSFLLIEADGFSFGPRHGLRARLYETFVIFSLLFLLILFFFCLILVVSGSFDVSDGLSVIPRLASEVTPMLRTLLSFIALLELLYGIPFGQQESLNNSTKSIMSIRPKENVKSELRRLKLEQQHIQRRIRYRHRLRRSSASPIELKRSEREINENIIELENLVSQSWIKRFIFGPVELGSTFIIMSVGICTSVFRTLQIVVPFDIFGFDQEHSNLRFSQRHFGQTSLAQNYGYLKFLMSFSKFCLAIWITKSAIRGFVLKLPRTWLPEYLATPLHKLILQCILWLHLCSAVPLLSALLTGLPLPIDFSGSPALIGTRYQICACVYYSVYSTLSIVQFLPLDVREKCLSFWTTIKTTIRAEKNQNKKNV